VSEFSLKHLKPQDVVLVLEVVLHCGLLHDQDLTNLLTVHGPETAGDCRRICAEIRLLWTTSVPRPIRAQNRRTPGLLSKNYTLLCDPLCPFSESLRIASRSQILAESIAACTGFTVQYGLKNKISYRNMRCKLAVILKHRRAGNVRLQIQLLWDVRRALGQQRGTRQFPLTFRVLP
jgi:hypothetical protein